MKPLRNRTAGGVELDGVRAKLGSRADEEIMNARLAGFSTEDLLRLAQTDQIVLCKGQWNQARMVLQTLGANQRQLFAQVMQANLSPQEIQTMLDNDALTAEGLETLIALRTKRGAARHEAAPKKQSLRDKLREKKLS